MVNFTVKQNIKLLIALCILKNIEAVGEKAKQSKKGSFSGT